MTNYTYEIQGKGGSWTIEVASANVTKGETVEIETKDSDNKGEYTVAKVIHRPGKPTHLVLKPKWR